MKNRLRRQTPNHLAKVLQQKHRTPSSVCNQPLEMLRNYEDRQAETLTIILDIQVIQVKEHHTDHELRSLAPKTLSVAYPSTTWARAYTYMVRRGQRQQKWRGWSFHQAPGWQINQEVFGHRAAVNKLHS